MNILEGKNVSDQIMADLKENIIREKATVGLAVVLVGDDKASKIYVGLKEKRAKEMGMDFFLYEFSKDTEELEIIEQIREINGNPRINGVIVQLPLPDKFDTQSVINEIDPKKDVDGFHPENTEKFKNGQEIFWPVFPKAIIELLVSSGQDIKGKSSVVIANSEKFGEVMKQAFCKRGVDADYVLFDRLEENMEKIKNSDIVVTAVGKPNVINADMIKAGSIVIDGGISEEDDKVLGDVDFESVKGKAGFLSPVPGGVGPVTIACLLENTYMAYKLQNKLDLN